MEYIPERYHLSPRNSRKATTHSLKWLQGKHNIFTSLTKSVKILF